MRAEQGVMTTRVLWAALASGALVLGLALSGVVGGTLGSVPLDPASVPTLPELPAAEPRLPALQAYAAIGERPVFAQDRRPRPYLLAGEQTGNNASAVRLTGVLQTPALQMATLTTDSDRSLRLRLNGDAVEGWQLVGLEPRRATVSGPGGTQVLELQVFNGQGGQPPTALAQPGRPGTIAAPRPQAGPPPAGPAGDPADAATAAATAIAPGQTTASPEQTNGPSEAQLRAIRERIQARRQQLQQQQRQQQQQQQQQQRHGQGNPAANR